jgi:membrane associated rhomboid family serine protease
MQRPRLALPDWLLPLPVVTLAFALLCVLVTAVVKLGYEGHAQRIAEELRDAATFAVQNPVVAVDPRLLPVVRGYMPGFDSNETFAFLRHNDAKTRRVQKKFDDLDEQAFGSLDRHPYRVLGLVPSRPTLLGLAAHAFVHPGWSHLLATLVLLLIAGPLLEDLWGRAFFAAALVGCTLVGAAAFGLVHGDADRALLGASGSVAALVTAATVRLRTQEVDLLRWLSPFAGTELVAPVWVLTAAWGVYEAALWWMVQGELPVGVDNAVGYADHAVAAAVGALSALAMQRLGGEARFGRRPAPVVVAATPERFDFQKVLAARARGDHERAWQMLRAEVQRSARNRDAVNTLWEMAIERGVAAEAAPALRLLVGEELRRGASERAVALWRELSEHAPNELPDGATMLRLIPLIRDVDGAESAAIALQQLLAASSRRVAPEVALQALALARELAPSLVGSAAERALAAPNLDAAKRQELEALVSRAAAPLDADAPPVDDEEKPELAPSVFYAESDRSAFGDAGVDLTVLDEQFPRGAVREALPRLLGDEGLSLEVPGEGAIDLAWSRLRAVALVGVHGLGPRPVLLIDLLIDGGGTERPLSVVRLRSDRFDPRAFAPAGTAPLDAVRGLVATLLARSRARALPDAAAAAAKPVKVYPALEVYHEQVLRPAGRELR